MKDKINKSEKCIDIQKSIRKWSWFATYHNDMMSKMMIYNEAYPSGGYGDFNNTNAQSLLIDDSLISLCQLADERT